MIMIILILCSGFGLLILLSAFNFLLSSFPTSRTDGAPLSRPDPRPLPTATVTISNRSIQRRAAAHTSAARHKLFSFWLGYRFQSLLRWIDWNLRWIDWKHVCSWCGRRQSGNPFAPRITHVMCESCAALELERDRTVAAWQRSTAAYSCCQTENIEH